MAWVKGVPPKMIHEHFGVYNGLWMPEMDKCWMDYDRGYQVLSRMINTKQFGNVEHVTISRFNPDSNEIEINMGGTAAMGWSEKFMIKNELFGEDRFAIEVYPKTDRLVDATDTYHLWVFNKKLECGSTLGIGIHPKEYKKAINRGATFYPEDAEALSAEMKKHGKLDDNSRISGLLGGI